MTKADLVNIIAVKSKQSSTKVEVIVNTLMEVVKESVAQGDTLYLRGFGNFQIKHRPERKARNIRKNEVITVPAHDFPVFKASKEFAGHVRAMSEKMDIE